MTLAIFIIAAVIIPIPLILSLRHAKGPMLSGGINSAIVAAACHVPILDVESSKDASDDFNEPKPQTQDSISNQKSQTSDSVDTRPSKRENHSTLAQKQDYLNRVAQGLVRWGDVHEGSDTLVRHLSFGTRGHDVRDPVDGQLYW